MRKTLLLGLVIILLFCGCGSKEILYKEGKFEGTGKGHHGPIRVVVTTDEYNIKDIEIIEEYEMPELAEIVYEKLPKKVISRNSVDVDVVSGASYTSKGLLEAITNALNKAKIENSQKVN